MRKFVPFAALFFLVALTVLEFSPPADAQEASCSEWMTDRTHDGIDLMVCQYTQGGSGYNRWRNRYDRDARISFRFNFRDGTHFEASTPIPAHGESGNASCWGCADSSTGGLQEWAITRFALEGDPGFF